MTLFATLTPIAASLIGQFGKPVTLTRVAQGAYNPATSAASSTPTETTVAAIIEDVDGAALANGLAETGDRKFTIPGQGLPFDPSPGDLITDALTVWTVRRVVAPIVGDSTPILEIYAWRS
jgi:hypothetical protein